MHSAIMAGTFKPWTLGILLVFRIIQKALHVNKRIVILTVQNANPFVYDQGPFLDKPKKNALRNVKCWCTELSHCEFTYFVLPYPRSHYYFLQWRKDLIKHTVTLLLQCYFSELKTMWIIFRNIDDHYFVVWVIPSPGCDNLVQK